jgi:hypothetical protein
MYNTYVRFILNHKIIFWFTYFALAHILELDRKDHLFAREYTTSCIVYKRIWSMMSNRDDN